MSSYLSFLNVIGPKPTRVSCAPGCELVALTLTLNSSLSDLYWALRIVTTSMELVDTVVKRHTGPTVTPASFNSSTRQ